MFLCPELVDEVRHTGVVGVGDGRIAESPALVAAVVFVGDDLRDGS